MNNIILKQSSINELKKELYIYQKKILDIEMKIMTLEKEIHTITDDEYNSTMFDDMILSKQQMEIVKSKSKNIMVVACPGSGKTHTIISRYINMVVCEKVDPNSIIMITFTKKAGMEMNQRIMNFLPNKLPFYVGSLHGLGYRTIQQFNNGVNFTVLDEKESHVLLRESSKKILEETLFDTEEITMLIKQIVYIYEKISVDYPMDINETLKKLSIASKYKTIIQSILKEYKNTKKEQNLVDFNDLMIQFCNLLGTKKINTFLEGIKYIFFDEYQDINPVQNYILNCFSTHSNIMVVGDDAQAIYAFRGSSVKYIWDFEKKFKNVTTYYLETNYRSTPSIVNFFQNTISHNTLQFKKKVISSQENIGMKPIIMCYNNMTEQYKWIASDIIDKKNNGIMLKDIVILARNNISLDRIEYELMKHSIPIVKSIGISLLNKSHIKDIIAFMIITTNPNTTIHWKRIISMSRGIGVTKANDIIESIVPFNGMTALEKYNITNTNSPFIELYSILKDIKSYKPKEQLHQILQYLINIWKQNKEKNLDTRINDINSMIHYIGNDSIEDFVSNLHLNIEICTTEDSLFLSTVHGSKGLEWEYVYIIDATSKDFPSIRKSFYRDEMDASEEERRLFYVACSRAKKYLTITSYIEPNNLIKISPYIREIDINLYIQSNILLQIETSYNLTGNVSTDIANYLQYYGYENLIKLIEPLTHSRSNILCKMNKNQYLNMSSNPMTCIQPNRFIAGNMMDIMVAKMLQNNFPELIKGFDLPQNYRDKIPQSIYHNYIDRLVDWRNIMEDIFYLSTFKINTTQIDITIWKEILLSETLINYYNYLEKSLVQYIEKLNPKKIQVHLNVSCEPIRGEIDILIDDILIEMKTTPEEACTFPNICQTIMYGYLLNKKQIIVNQIILLNLWDGMMDKIIISDFNYNKFKKILYDIKN